MPSDDPMAARLLAMRNHAFPGYTVGAFEDALTKRFTISRREPIPGSGRILYFMEAA